MRDRTSVMFAAVLTCVVSLVVAAGIYAVPALRYFDDDVCLTPGPQREGGTILQRRSWWPIGVECRYRVSAKAEPIARFEGPAGQLRWIALGMAVLGLGVAIAGVGVGIRDLTSTDPV